LRRWGRLNPARRAFLACLAGSLPLAVAVLVRYEVARYFGDEVNA
jgi:hypothetical protein